MELNDAAGVLAGVLPFLYAVLVAVYGRAFFASTRSTGRGNTYALFATIAIHIAYLVVHSAGVGHPPITSVFEIMSMLAVCIALGYAYIEVRTKTSNTGFFILLLPLLFQSVSSIFIRENGTIPDYLHSAVLGIHVSAALLGYTAICLSAVYGFLYLMLYHAIKSERFGVIYNRLPNLEMLEAMSHRAEVLGFTMLSVAICIGVLWLPRVFSNYSYLDPKLVGTFVIWALYAGGLGAKRRFGWQGRRTMILAVVGFGFVFLSMTVVNLYLSSFHTFH